MYEAPVDGVSFTTAVNGSSVPRSRHQQQQQHLLHPCSAATAPIAAQTLVADFQPPYFPPPYAQVPQTPSAMPTSIVDFQRHFSVAAAAAAGATDPYSYASSAPGGTTSQHSYLGGGRQSLLQAAQAVAASGAFDFDGFQRGFGNGSSVSSAGNCLMYNAPVVSTSSSDGSTCSGNKTTANSGNYQYSMSSYHDSRRAGMSQNESNAYCGGRSLGLGGTLGSGQCLADSVTFHQALHGTSLHEIQLNEDLAAQVGLDI